MIKKSNSLQERYAIEKQIAGGMGAVLSGGGRRKISGSHVAIELYKDADLRDAFEREARLLNSLHHPVLHVSIICRQQRVMRFIDGEDMSIIKRRRVSVERSALWTDSLLETRSLSAFTGAADYSPRHQAARI